MSDAVLTILGVTGYSGRLCAAAAVRQGIPIRLAGRRRDALQALAGELGTDAELVTVDAGDRGGLKDLAKSSDVLLSCVGPYEKLGRPVVDACIEMATPYTDISGEVGFLRWVYEQDRRATDAAVALVPGAGFDGVGEFAAALAVSRLGETRVDEARVAYATRGVVMSRGTSRSMLGAVGQGVLTTRDGDIVTEALGSRGWTVDFPPPYGRRRALVAPMPEGLTMARSLPAETARAYFVLPLGRVAGPLARPTQAVMRGLSLTPVWGLAHRLVDRLPEGAPAQRRERSAAAIVAEVHAGDAVAVATIKLSDIYGSAALVALAISRRLLDGEVKPGVKTPAQAAPPAEILSEIGASFSY